MKDTLFGLHAVLAVLEKQADRVFHLCVDKTRRDEKITHILQLAKKQKISVEFSDKKSLDKITKDATHQGVVAYVKKAKEKSEQELDELLDELNEPAFLLILDGVQDPHNLGAILRTADAAGVHAVIAPKDNAVPVNATVSKVASGGAESVPFFQVTNLSRAMEKLKARGIWLYGADGATDKTVYDTDLSGALAIVMGAEGKGMRRLTAETCDALMKIPMVGTVESLNVSVATGILLFEARRRR